MPQPQSAGIIRFGVFELEPKVGILRKHGVRIRLQEQPFRVLLVLLEKPGEPVTREELQQTIWAGTAFGDFDHSLNIAVNRIREALGDSAETPRFVETLPRRGYRFIAPVEGRVAPPAEAVPPVAPVRARTPKWFPLAGASLAATALVGGIAAWLFAPAAPAALEWHRLTNDNLFPKVAPVLSDGSRLYFVAGWWNKRQVFQVPVSGGEPTRLPIVSQQGQQFGLFDITPDGQELLIAPYISVPGESLPLWTVRIADGSSRRVADLLAREARYSPDGNRIAYTVGGRGVPGSLWVASGDGANPRRLLELKGLEITRPCWSPDGTRIAFGRSNLASEESSAWAVRADGTRLRRLLPDWRRGHLPGGWTSDGRLLLISDGQLWIAQQRRFFQFRQPPPLQLSAAEPFFYSPLQLRDHGSFYAIGRTPLGQLQRFDTKSGSWEPHLGGISADSVEYSRDGQSLTYTTYPGDELWVRRADGSRLVQLTKSPMKVQLSRWSPDGKVIGFMGKARPEQPWAIYIVDAAGGIARLACPKGCGPQGDFTWSLDGRTIVYAAHLSLPEDEMYLRVLDLDTGKVTKFPGSEGLHAPHWSPDGSVLLAQTRAAKAGLPFGSINSLALYRPSVAKWEVIGHPSGAGTPTWPSWSHDGKSIWYYSFAGGTIMRYLVQERRHEEVLHVSQDEMTGFIGFWFSLTPADEPMTLRRRDIQQIYALDWKPR